MEKTVVKICCWEWDNASRDKRELTVCKELGLNTLVMTKGENKDCGRKDKIDNFDVVKYSTRPLGEKIPNSINRFITLFVWAYYVRRMKVEILSCHDLPALFIGWVSTIFQGNKPKLIYDSHEFEIGRNTSRNRFQKWFILHMERFLIKRCVFSIMVNDVIADEVQRIHKLGERPIVVRSTPSYWHIDQKICSDTRTKLLNLMESPQEMLLMYHGGVLRGRGVEKLFEVVSKLPYTCIVVLGNGEKKYIESLHKLAEDLRVSERVLFHEAVPIEELWKYVGAADVGMILAPAIVLNHLYSLPNKFFENIQSETPIICPSYPAMQPIVEKYQIGVTCNPVDMKEVIHCIEKMHDDKEYYNQCKENLKKAKQDLCWEKEKEIVKNAYSKLL